MLVSSQSRITLHANSCSHTQVRRAGLQIITQTLVRLQLRGEGLRLRSMYLCTDSLPNATRASKPTSPLHLFVYLGILTAISCSAIWGQSEVGHKFAWEYVDVFVFAL